MIGPFIIVNKPTETEQTEQTDQSVFCCLGRFSDFSHGHLCIWSPFEICNNDSFCKGRIGRERAIRVERMSKEWGGEKN